MSRKSVLVIGTGHPAYRVRKLARDRGYEMVQVAKRRTPVAERRQHIGLEEADDGIWAIHFNTVLPATFDERDYSITS
jgi:hypothetical protein